MTTISLASRLSEATLFALVMRHTGAIGRKQAGIIEAAAETLPALMELFRINTPARIEPFLAQTAHECDNFATTEEYASGAAYDGRRDLGNTKDGDGRRFKGRAYIQLTGRANYRAFTAWMRQHKADCPDFEAEPELVAQAPWAAWATVYFWSSRDLNALADRGDFVGITRKINGGTNGLADRRTKLAKAKLVVAKMQAELVAEKQGIAPLRRGSEGSAVERLQRALAAAGHYLLTIDGEFGPGTEGAVKTFQRSRGLIVDGIVGEQTLVALEPFEQDQAA
ncbi:peptidoglycan-binding protein [Rhizobium sp. CC-YZS058]|uniref:peptidoglycan-binding protein n=1 Tax=Rhizobium sp. CC-YZS058 TaxID=3042153 RepID=UPI002B057AD7|nr:peptidoglycan-binding protein [Rhizobium sp. CC-YZS058]MEA3533708.1 peptidoglycan-binding protein [Rhizobium sp. CC-YZS058]